MLLHYLKIAFRNILKDKVYSLINLIGLFAAIACCFLLIFWIKFELTFEDCHPKAGRIYKVLEVEKRTDGFVKKEYIPGIARELKQAFPEIETAIVISHYEFKPFFYEDKEAIMLDYTRTAPDYLDMFTYEYIEGNKENVLKNGGAIISEETAKRFFGTEPAIGKTVATGGEPFVETFNIQAVVRIPQNTHFKFGLLDITRPRNDGQHYILVKENTRFSEETQRRMADFLGTIRETENKLSFLPVKDIHLHSPQELANNSVWQTFGDLNQIYLYSIVALLVLSIAVINYINTSTARAINRMKEVGVRKVTGSTQRQLILRFLSEAFIISAAAIVFALIASKILFPEFSMLMGYQVSFHLDFNTILIALAVCLLITLFSGGYAAFYLSSFDPVTVLRGGNNTGSKDNLRKILIGFQFILSIGMFISTWIIYKQVHYIFTTDTGINRENIIMLDAGLWYSVDDFREVMTRENPNVLDATITTVAPYNVGFNYKGVSWEGHPDELKEVEFGHIFCNYRYANTFGLKMIEGEFIQPWGWWQFTDEKSYNIVINESFKKLMGVDNPIGITVKYGQGETGKIVGVVKDFNFKPLKEPITPLLISYNPEICMNVFVKTTGKDKKETLDYILKKYREMGPLTGGRPVIYRTAEEDYNNMYQSEVRTMKMLTIFSIISLCLSIMGIFGMVSFMIEKRTKEIAIRRINGAETKDVIALFIFDFLKIIGIACAIAIPVSFYILFRWIQTYAFRTSLSWWIFVLVPLCISLITALLIAVQVYLTTRQNPADVIKTE